MLPFESLGVLYLPKQDLKVSVDLRDRVVLPEAFVIRKLSDAEVLDVVFTLIALSSAEEIETIGELGCSRAFYCMGPFPPYDYGSKRQDFTCI